MAKAKKGKATIMLVPHDGAAVFTLKFPSILLRLVPFALAGFVGFGAWFGWSYEKARESFQRYQSLISENRNLKQELDKMGEMEKQLKELERFGTRIRTFAGLGPASQETGEADGTEDQESSQEPSGHQGGPDSPGLLWDAFGGPNLLWHVDGGMAPSGLQHRLLTQRISFEEILSYVVEQREQMAQTPSIWPISKETFADRWISSSFGKRKSPFSGLWEFHSGVDIVAPRRAPIRATADGVVIFVGYKPGLGKLVVVDHDGFYETSYGHCDKLLVKEGQAVKRGDSLATVGMSGRTTGVHVHYEVRMHGQPANPLDYMLD